MATRAQPARYGVITVKYGAYGKTTDTHIIYMYISAQPSCSSCFANFDSAILNFAPTIYERSRPPQTPYSPPSTLVSFVSQNTKREEIQALNKYQVGLAYFFVRCIINDAYSQSLCVICFEDPYMKISIISCVLQSIYN